MNKVSKLGMLFNEGNVPDFGSIQMQSNDTNIYYLLAQDIPKLNGMLTKEAATSYLIENETLNIRNGALAYVIDYRTASSGKIYVYHRGKDHWYEFNVRSDLELWDLMWNRHERILKETKTISGTPPLTFKSNGRPMKNYRIYGNTVNEESVGDLVTEGDHAGEYSITVTLSRKAKHTATLQLHDCLPSTMQFDAPEALYYAENGLSAGTYNFTIQAGYDETYGGGKTYQFTLENDVPPGGQLTFGWNNNTQAINAKITSYTSSASTAAIEQVSVSEGSAGTNLGTTDGNSADINHIHRVRFGSNNYGESAIRQFLNSSASAGNVWTPQTKYDRPPSWASDTKGFMQDLDTDFLSAVGISHKVTALDTVTNIGGSVTHDDKFFLISRSEVYSGKENNINEGEPYPYYSDYSDLQAAGTGEDSNRIKLKDDTAQWWWLRSPYSAYGNYVRAVNLSGTIHNAYAIYNRGVAPACNIELDENYAYNGTVLHVRDQISVTKGNDTLVFDVIGIDHDDVDFDTQTISLYLPEQIKMVGDEPEYIDYKKQKQYFADGTSTDVTLPAHPTFPGTNTLSVGTTVQPSKVYLQGKISEAEIVSAEPVQTNVQSLQPLSLDDDDFQLDVMPTESDLQLDVIIPTENLNGIKDNENEE